MIRLTKYILATIFLNWIFAMPCAAEQPGTAKTQSSGTFQVTVNKDYLSLQANDASLAQVFEEIGKQAKISFDSNIGPEEKITINLERVPLEQGIRQLARNVTVFYAQDLNNKARRIERVVVLSEGSGSSGQAIGASEPDKAKQPAPQAAKASKPLPQSEPFKFEFDPAKFGGKEKAGKQP
jgi:hypothetical protein